jgi:UDP-glucose 4-epimerase
MTDVVLVTGGFGYLGGRVARQLAEAGMSVRLATRQADAAPPAWLAKANVVSMDLDNDAGIEHACSGVTSVVHLAALNEHDCAADPQRALRVNGLGTLKLLQAAQRCRVNRFIYFSTAHVYGAPLAGAITERTLPRPTHPYAITHHIAEDFVLAARDRGAIEGIVLRMSNGFGVPAHAGINQWTLIVNDLCRQAVSNRKLILRSSGIQLRDFVTLGDAARAVEHLLRLPAAACGDGLFNLGGECVLSMVDLAERVASRCQIVLGFRPAILRPPPAPGEKAVALDYRIDKLKQTGFALSGGMDAEIDATIRLCQEAFGATP